MFSWTKKTKSRRKQVRRRKAELDAGRQSMAGQIWSWQTGMSLLFLVTVAVIPLLGRNRIAFTEGQRVTQPIYAQVDFEIPDLARTAMDREAARAETPSYYRMNQAALTSDKIRAEMMSLYQAAADAEDFEAFQAILTERKWPAEARAYTRLREWSEMANDAGRQKFSDLIDRLPFSEEWVASDIYQEPRTPKSTRDFILLNRDEKDAKPQRVEHSKLVSQNSERAVRGSASSIARRLRSTGAYELTAVIEEIIFQVFSDQPTILFDQEQTIDAMRQAAEQTPDAVALFEKNTAIIPAGTTLGSTDIELLAAHHDAYYKLIESDRLDAQAARLDATLQRTGTVMVVVMLAIGLLIYTRMHQPRIFESLARNIAFLTLIAVNLLGVRLLMLEWPQLPALVFFPTLVSACILSIVYQRRFAIGSMCIVATIVVMSVQGDVMLLLAMYTAIATAGQQLAEIRSRTKIIEAGFVTALAIMLVTMAGGLIEGMNLEVLVGQVLWAGGWALLAFFVASGLVPFIERAFRVATSLTLLEWRDPTRDLLQKLAREAPGTYNHSLVLGTLAEAACERIGANALLAQVGALYHDIGKIHKADYFVENQEGGINRHDNLAPTMSLLIIVGHVKDGIEMAKEYKLPRVLHQFIAEHHGTTVVRYFHHMASEQQPRIASGKHDREVPEAEFRYSGPKPRTKESAVVMLCDGVEGAVRALNEPTVGRIESVVHQVVKSRVNDGQLSDCDMTMREVQVVEDSLVKTLCSIYHGRVAYPKADKASERPSKQEEKVSV
ncbi:MAG: HD family phosphohydrolase [Planctomycetota bacterium]|jgi:putative nucleotidyltransferase with HDIG domain